MLGTIDFIAPEQALDAASADIRADIYALGGTLFWCLIGRYPFPAKGSTAEEINRRLSQPPPSARELRPEVPRAARAAARAAGHAAGTAHMAGHARHAAAYAVNAAAAAAIPTDAVAVTGTERDWQYRRLPEHLRPIAFPDRLEV
jgi:serine/threonine protein kinase